MAKIVGIRIQNFRCLKDISLGDTTKNTNAEPLSSLTVIIGKNGVGKSTLFDAFGFLADALKVGVEEACDKRGGFEKIRSQGQTEPIYFEICYRERDISPINYYIQVNADENGRPFIKTEILVECLTVFLKLSDGCGFVSKDGFDGFCISPNSKELVLSYHEQKDARLKKSILKKYGAEAVELTDKRKLGIATLGALKKHLKISALRQFLESWYLSYFTPDAARSLPLDGVHQHLNSRGDNLANVVKYMEREYGDKFQEILDSIAEKIPGIHKISTQKTPDGRLLLCFNDKGFQDPFYAPQMSDGTLRVFAYLLLLEAPNPPPFICIEEPENGLYHKLLEVLAAEFRAHTQRENGSQLFITTHQPYFVDALDPDEVWVLEKGEDGFSTITRASEIPYVQNMVNEGQPLGALWYSDYLDAR